MAASAVSPPPTSNSPDGLEWLRMKWFALGVLATSVGVWLGANL
jgi:hypothetical protein